MATSVSRLTSSIYNAAYTSLKATFGPDVSGLLPAEQAGIDAHWQKLATVISQAVAPTVLAELTANADIVSASHTGSMLNSPAGQACSPTETTAPSIIVGTGSIL